MATANVTSTAPVFLVGAQRSGTTVLGLGLARAFAGRGGRFTVNGKLPYLLRRWWTSADLACGHLRADEVEHGLRRLPVGGAGDAAWLDRAATALAAAAAGAAGMRGGGVEEGVRRVCAEAYGTALWGDKYNEYLLDLPWLQRVFPEARWVFLAREPADAVASMLGWRREKAWNPREEAAAAAKWAAWNRRWLVFRGSLRDGQAIELGYEQLAGDGAVRLSDWLGLDVAAQLGGFEPRRHGGDLELPPQARAVRRSLAALGLLG